ncbi:MAG TPA: WbqC family protein, partial [Terriglobales bacterium]
TIPVTVKGHFEQTIAQAEIANLEFWKSHLRSVEMNYRRAPFFDTYFDGFTAVLGPEHGNSSLACLNIRLIQWFCRILGIQTPICRSSELSQQGRRSELLVNLCLSLNADYYLSALGSAVYLCDDLQRFSEVGIEVGFQHYEHPAYCQLFPPFVPYASTLDLIFNEGPMATEIIRSGRRPAFRSSELPVEATLVKKS